MVAANWRGCEGGLRRIGINLGDVIVEGDDLYGDGVNIAARIEALADAGGVFISNTVHDQVRDRLPFVFEDLGEQQVKNIARPVRVYRVRDVAAARSPSTPALSRPSQHENRCEKPPLGDTLEHSITTSQCVVSL